MNTLNVLVCLSAILSIVFGGAILKIQPQTQNLDKSIHLGAAISYDARQSTESVAIADTTLDISTGVALDKESHGNLCVDVGKESPSKITHLEFHHQHETSVALETYGQDRWITGPHFHLIFKSLVTFVFFVLPVMSLIVRHCMEIGMLGGPILMVVITGIPLLIFVGNRGLSFIISGLISKFFVGSISVVVTHLPAIFMVREVVIRTVSLWVPTFLEEVHTLIYDRIVAFKDLLSKEISVGVQHLVKTVSYFMYLAKHFFFKVAFGHAWKPVAWGEKEWVVDIWGSTSWITDVSVTVGSNVIQMIALPVRKLLDRYA